MKVSEEKCAEKPIPRILRKPMIPASVLLALDILTLATAAVLTAVRTNIKERYFYADGVVTGSDPYSWFGIVAAVMIAVAAATAALIIAGALLGRSNHTLKTVTAFLLLILSSGTASFSLMTVTGEKPKNVVFTTFTDEENRLIFAEEEYRKENLLKIYFSENAASGETECRMLACMELMDLSQGNAEERYMVHYLGKSMLVVVFADGTGYRTLELIL